MCRVLFALRKALERLLTPPDPSREQEIVELLKRNNELLDRAVCALERLAND